MTKWHNWLCSMYHVLFQTEKCKTNGFGLTVPLTNSERMNEQTRQLRPFFHGRLIKWVYRMTYCTCVICCPVDGLLSSLWTDRLEVLSKAWERRFSTRLHVCSAKRWTSHPTPPPHAHPRISSPIHWEEAGSVKIRSDWIRSDLLTLDVFTFDWVHSASLD